jgi:CelD/BcsL family acetyltransferase involved in cellulose biosynthesis
MDRVTAIPNVSSDRAGFDPKGASQYHLMADAEIYASEGRQSRSERLSVSVTADIAALADDWRAFEETAAGHIFQSYVWVSTWQRHVGAARGIEPKIVVVRGGSQIQCLLPFGLRKSYGTRVLEWLGGEHADYQGGLFSPAFLSSQDHDAFREIWRRCLNAIGPIGRIDLIKQPRSFGNHPNPFLALTHADSVGLGHLTDLGADFDAYYAAKRGSRSRKTDRRKLKSLAAAGPLTFWQPQSLDEIRATMDLILEQKNRALARRGAKSPFVDPQVQAFLLEIGALT